MSSVAPENDEFAQASVDFQHSEARFQAIFESAAIGVAILDLQTLVMRYNAAARQMVGVAQSEYLLSSVYDLLYIDYQESERQYLDEMLRGERQTFESDHHYHPQGSAPRWAHVTFSAVRAADGRLHFIIALLHDITDQRQIQQDLRQSEARFRAMFENSGIGIALVGLDRKPLAVNDSLLRASGYSRAELMGSSGFDLSYPEDRLLGLEQFRQLAAGEINSYQVERRYLHKEGHPYWVRQTISGVRNQTGHIEYLIVMVEDIDQQKQDQERLRESEARFRAMFDNSAVGMALMTLDRRVVSINRVAEQLTGYSMEEMVGNDPAFLSHPDDLDVGRQQFAEMVAGRIRSFQMEKRYIHKQGHVFWARVSYSVVPDKNGQPLNLVGMIEDITEQKMNAARLAAQEEEDRRTLEQRVEERTQALTAANQRLLDEIEQRQRAEKALATKAAEEAISAERTRLARDLHDAVTQTLFSASLIAEVLPELWDLDEAEARKSSEELRQLTRGALAEMRTLLLELRPTALIQARFPELLRQLSEAVIGRARLPVTLLVDGECELSPELKVAFYRIAQESLNNIVKYARATQVEIRLRQAPHFLRLEISDNGVGFDPIQLKPTSLGMRIMRERADAVHARFNLESSPGHGTTVSVEWQPPLDAPGVQD